MTAPRPGCTCPHIDHDLVSGPCRTPGCWCVLDLTARHNRPRLASEMPGWIGSEPPPDVLTEDDSWDRWPA